MICMNNSVSGWWSKYTRDLESLGIECEPCEKVKKVKQKISMLIRKKTFRTKHIFFLFNSYVKKNWIIIDMQLAFI